MGEGMNGQTPPTGPTAGVTAAIGAELSGQTRLVELAAGVTSDIENTEVSVNDCIQQGLDSVRYTSLSEEEKLFVATVCGESIGQGEVGWKAVSNIIMNRTYSSHFPDTVTEVIQEPYAFSAYEDQSPEYIKAINYLENRAYGNELYEEVISVAVAIYRGDDSNDITQGSTFYFSPVSMDPVGSVPAWTSNGLEEIYIDSIDSNDFRFYRYKDDCLE